jgi:hypothetical protein
LDGEKKFGSMFSVSRSSSKGSGERRRFIGELRVTLDGEVSTAAEVFQHDAQPNYGFTRDGRVVIPFCLFLMLPSA